MRRAALLVLLVLARTAGAHPLQMGYLRLEASDTRIDLSLELDVSFAAKLLRVDERALDDGTVPARAADLAAASYREVAIDGCTWGAPTAALHRRTIVLEDVATCTRLDSLRWPLPFVQHVAPTFQLLVQAHAWGHERVAIVDRITPAFELGSAADARAGVTLPEFVWKGIEHIGATPGQWHGAGGFTLPDGIDHILFLLGLLLAGGSILRLIGVASGFTVGHTITLGLAAFGVVQPPNRVIEPLIALTIAFVAVEAYTGKFERHRWKIAACFGLIHGFGFANALTQLHLARADLAKALFGYNLGVELGQIVIVLAIAPGVLLAYRHPVLRRYVVRGAAAAIFVAGMYWFFVRLFA